MKSEKNLTTIAIWFLGFLTLTWISIAGLSSAFPMHIAVPLGVLLTGLASSAFYFFKQQGNPMFMALGGVMLILCAASDGIGFYEFLKNGDRADSVVASSQATVTEEHLYAKKSELERANEGILTLTARIESMDNDGNGSNDHLIPGERARLAEQRTQVAQLRTEIGAIQADVNRTRAAAMQTESAQHFALQLATTAADGEEAKTAVMIAGIGAIFFFFLELAVALMAASSFTTYRPGTDTREETIEPKPEQKSDPPAATPLHSNSQPSMAEILEALNAASARNVPVTSLNRSNFQPVSAQPVVPEPIIPEPAKPKPEPEPLRTESAPTAAPVLSTREDMTTLNIGADAGEQLELELESDRSAKKGESEPTTTQAEMPVNPIARQVGRGRPTKSPVVPSLDITKCADAKWWIRALNRARVLDRPYSDTELQSMPLLEKQKKVIEAITRTKQAADVKMECSA